MNIEVSSVDEILYKEKRNTRENREMAEVKHQETAALKRKQGVAGGGERRRPEQYILRA